MRCQAAALGRRRGLSGECALAITTAAPLAAIAAPRAAEPARAARAAAARPRRTGVPCRIASALAALVALVVALVGILRGALRWARARTLRTPRVSHLLLHPLAAAPL